MRKVRAIFSGRTLFDEESQAIPQHPRSLEPLADFLGMVCLERGLLHKAKPMVLIRSKALTQSGSWTRSYAEQLCAAWKPCHALVASNEWHPQQMHEILRIGRSLSCCLCGAISSRRCQSNKTKLMIESSQLLNCLPCSSTYFLVSLRASWWEHWATMIRVVL